MNKDSRCCFFTILLIFWSSLMYNKYSTDCRATRPSLFYFLARCKKSRANALDVFHYAQKGGITTAL